MKKTGKVLIVEDDKFILKAMDYKFNEAGFEVKVAMSAEEGLEVLKSWIPDVIVLDVLLPGIDGYAFLRTIKTDPKLEKIPSIISSNLDEEDSESLENEYIVKSNLDLDELVKKVKKYLV